MKIVADIGNTNIVVGIKNRGNWEHIWRFKTDKKGNSYQYSLKLNNLLWEAGIHPDKLTGKILSSVVPELKETYIKVLEGLNTLPVIVLDKNLYPKLDIKILNPNEIGTDLVANALAAHHKIQDNVIIIDFGTALTFTVIDKKGEILGVNIAPGIKTAINALSDKASQLDWVPLEVPEIPLGTDTKTAIQNGVLIGYTGLISHMIKTIKNYLNGEFTVIATGGLSGVLQGYLPQINHFDKNLTLDGLALLPELIENRKKS